MDLRESEHFLGFDPARELGLEKQRFCTLVDVGNFHPLGSFQDLQQILTKSRRGNSERSARLISNPEENFTDCAGYDAKIAVACVRKLPF